ncbi:MAG: hypothetical protein ACF8GE_07420 [Phycisphaerales bacterium JB043]
MIRAITTAAASIAIASASTSAFGVNELHLDVNSITVSTAGGGAFGGTSHTGTLLLSGDVTTTLADILIDGVSQAESYSTIAVSGSITLVGGAVTGGGFTITIDGTETYSASIVSGVGAIVAQPGQGFLVGGLTFGGFFNTTSYASVDVTPWDSAEPLHGSFLNFSYGPDGSGVDTDSDLDVYILIPTPAAAGLATVGLAGLTLRRRRAL